MKLCRHTLPCRSSSMTTRHQAQKDMSQSNFIMLMCDNDWCQNWRAIRAHRVIAGQNPVAVMAVGHCSHRRLMRLQRTNWLQFPAHPIIQLLWTRKPLEDFKICPSLTRNTRPTNEGQLTCRTLSKANPAAPAQSANSPECAAAKTRRPPGVHTIALMVVLDCTRHPAVSVSSANHLLTTDGHHWWFGLAPITALC